MENLRLQLEQLGFSDKEAKVYITLNNIGTASASTLARLTNIKRTSIYDVLHRLLEENYIRSFQRESTTHYTIDSLSKIVTKEKEKLSIAETLLKSLEQQKQEGVVDIQYFRGASGLHEMYDDIIKHKPKEMCAMVNIDEFYKIFEATGDREWTDVRVEHNIYARLLMVDTPGGRELQSEDEICLRETYLFPKSQQFNPAIFIYEGHVSIMDFQGELTGVRIANRQIYTMQQGLFDYLWELFSTQPQNKKKPS